MACGAYGTAASNSSVIGYDSAPCAIVMLVNGHYVVGCIKSDRTTELFLQCCGSLVHAQNAAQTFATSKGYSCDPQLRKLSYPVMTVHKSSDGSYCPAKVDSFSLQLFEAWNGRSVRGKLSYAQHMSEIIGLQGASVNGIPDPDFSPTIATIQCTYSHCPEEYTPYQRTGHAFSTSSQQHVSMQAGKDSSTLQVTDRDAADAEGAEGAEGEGHEAAVMLHTLFQ